MSLLRRYDKVRSSLLSIINIVWSSLTEMKNNYLPQHSKPCTSQFAFRLSVNKITRLISKSNKNHVKFVSNCRVSNASYCCAASVIKIRKSANKLKRKSLYQEVSLWFCKKVIDFSASKNFSCQQRFSIEWI